MEEEQKIAARVVSFLYSKSPVSGREQHLMMNQTLVVGAAGNCDFRILREASAQEAKVVPTTRAKHLSLATVTVTVTVPGMSRRTP